MLVQIHAKYVRKTDIKHMMHLIHLSKWMCLFQTESAENFVYIIV